MSTTDANTPPPGKIIIYQPEEGNNRIDVWLVDATIWPAHRRSNGSVVHRTSF